MGSEKIKFDLQTKFKPSGDQPKSIESIIENINKGIKRQTLLGVTGSGKTFTMAHVIKSLKIPTLILAHNKTLAAQLYGEFKELFPNNAVEYFVSYYDYYQPEAYLPSTDTFIEKDSSINERIDRMRHSATRSLLDRNDVIIVSSVSCIYGLGSPDEYNKLRITLNVNQEITRESLLTELVKILYNRNDDDFSRGTFRVRGDVIDVFPPYEENMALRIELFGNYIDKLSWIDPIKSTLFQECNTVSIYPGSHHIHSKERQKIAINSIREELSEQLDILKNDIRMMEAKRLEQRTEFDIEMIEEMGFCHGIENYSRHFTGKKAGEPPPTLLDYFTKNFLCIIDESHVTVPQLGGMYRGDRSRKLTLVEHGFRLPSALDNRPLNFEELNKLLNKVLYVSATPGDYEIKDSNGLITEQIIRPTGLLDPKVEIQPATFQVDHLLGEIKKRAKLKERILVTTLTKKSAEDLTQYYEKMGIKVKYLHSDIKTIERSDILKNLRLGVFDCLIGINLLREGLDLPEVSLVAIFDADREGFLRSEKSLVQTIGRAARHINGKVFLYADNMTGSIKNAIKETNRRRKIQEEHNKTYSITPTGIKKDIQGSLQDIYVKYNVSKTKKLQPENIEKQIKKLKKQMKTLVSNLEFEEAATIRDKIKQLEFLDLELK